MHGVTSARKRHCTRRLVGCAVFTVAAVLVFVNISNRPVSEVDDDSLHMAPIMEELEAYVEEGYLQEVDPDPAHHALFPSSSEKSQNYNFSQRVEGPEDLGHTLSTLSPPAGGRSTIDIFYEAGSSPSDIWVPRRSWTVCHCAEGLGCFLLLGKQRVRVVGNSAVVYPSNGGLEELEGVLRTCKLNVKVRIATEKERKLMHRDCAREDIITRPVLTMMAHKIFDYHPYHSVMYPAGAFQFYSVHKAATRVIASRGLSAPTRAIHLPLKRAPHIHYYEPISSTKLLEFALTVGGTPPEIFRDPPQGSSCSLYHTLGLWAPRGLFSSPADGYTVHVPTPVANEFRLFRNYIRSKSLEQFGETHFNSTHPVLYCPRTVYCEPQRVRYVPADHLATISSILLNSTRGGSLAIDNMTGPLSEFRHHFHRIRSSRIMFGAEGAFFTWLLLAKPKSIWVMYFRAPPNSHRAHSFFTSMVRFLPDVKLIVYVVTSGVAPPFDQLRAALEEPFQPNKPKFIGSDANGRAPSELGNITDPLQTNCSRS